MKKYWKEVYGYFNHAEGHLMQRLCKGWDVLEIGAFYGKSTLCIADVARRVFTVDTFRPHDNGVQQMEDFTTLEKFQKHKRGYDNIFAIAGRSEEVVPALKLRVQVVFVDGLHVYEQVKKDIEVCWPKLLPGGIITFHDYSSYNHEVGKAVHEFAESLNLRVDVPLPNIAMMVKPNNNG